jgi:cytochrome P450
VAIVLKLLTELLETMQKNQYIKDLENTARLGGLRATFPGLFKISMHVAPLPIMRAASESFKRTRSYAEQSIQRYKRLLASDPVNTTPTLFAKLFRAGDEGMPDEEIRTEALAYIVAGSDTTANTLTYLIWSVCRDKGIRQALAEELSGLPEDFGDQHLKELPYLNRVIDETLRLYSAAPSGLPRTVPSGGVDLAGYFLPGGTTVCTQAYSLHRDPNIFPSPEKFDPSRWESPTRAMKDLFMPFGGGSRGEQLLDLHLLNTYNTRRDCYSISSQRIIHYS